VHKLYGHGYELYAVAADPGGRLVASACRSAKPEEAAIIIWRTGIWKQVLYRLWNRYGTGTVPSLLRVHVPCSLRFVTSRL
jgi:hypothetical protein